MDPARRADLSRTWAVVPIRGLETAKMRLGADLDPEERRGLVAELLRRTLVATRDARRVAGTVVVTMDPAAAGLARSHRAIGLVERAPGLNEAIEAARSLAVARGATAVLVLPADLPAAAPEHVDALIEAAAGFDAPAGLIALVYLAAGWQMMIDIPAYFGGLDAAELTMVAVGGGLYSVGAIIYALKRPNPWPAVFGFHEVFHTFVVGGAACHWVALLLLTV